jgi:hypothetical protein
MAKYSKYVKKLNGKPLSMWISGLTLWECRRLFRYRATLRGATPTQHDIDEALWQTIETGQPAPTRH